MVQVFISLNSFSAGIFSEIANLSVSRYQNLLSCVIQERHCLLLDDNRFPNCGFCASRIIYL